MCKDGGDNKDIQRRLQAGVATRKGYIWLGKTATDRRAGGEVRGNRNNRVRIICKVGGQKEDESIKRRMELAYFGNFTTKYSILGLGDTIR